MKEISKDTPNCNVILVGMAGSGKTTLLSTLSSTTESYLINLDPACNDPPYSPNIDIRDTINYKEIMREYNLGPNGAIVTSLNLYSTKIDQLVTMIEKSQKLTFIDTPGQIEVFTWSASGTLISESFSSFAPTIYLYVVDTARCVENPNTFMANMTYACSILYKTKLPLIIVFTKTDVVSCQKLNDWMDDYDNFLNDLNKHHSYSNELQKSLCYVLDEFYNSILHVGVSAKTGEGIEDLLKTIEKGKEMFFEDYYELIKKRKKEIEELEEMKKKKQFEKFKKDKMNEDNEMNKKRRRDDDGIDGDFVGSAGLNMFGDEDEGIIFRNGQRFFYGKTIDETYDDIEDSDE